MEMEPEHETNYLEADRLVNVDLKVRDRARTEEEKKISRLNCLQDTREYCRRAGIEQHHLEKLVVIHITGSKGKGSTCALTERILAHHKLKTGLFTSPHLLYTRERIRINGKSVSKELYNEHFWPVYNAIMGKVTEEDPRFPHHAQMYFVLALKIFLASDIDAIVVEACTGGERDCTNIIPHPIACGITSLELEHADLLGPTLNDVAWHKGGIFKTGTPAFIFNQEPYLLDVLRERAQERHCPLHIIPAYEEYKWGGKEAKIGLLGDVQRWNASLAIQLTQTFLQRYQLPLSERCKPYIHASHTDSSSTIPNASSFIVPYQTRLGLKNAFWPGRHHIIERPNSTFYLDCAHTKKSIEFCAEWFDKTSQEKARKLEGTSYEGSRRYLLFNHVSKRLIEDLLTPLAGIQFDAALFCPFLQTKDSQSKSFDVFMEKCRHRRDTWLKLRNERLPSDESGSETTQIFTNMTDAIEWCNVHAQSTTTHGNAHAHILIIGGMRLVGIALNILDPEVFDRAPVMEHI